MLAKLKLFGFSWLILVTFVIVAACGDSTATSSPVPTTAAVTTRAATTIAVTTSAATTTSATTSSATTAPATIVALTTVAAPAAVAPTATTAAVALDPQKVEAGKKVFVTQCQGCHPQEGKAAGYGPNLATSQHALEPDYIRGNVRNGRGQMIAFDKSQVSDADLENIILYLKSIHQG